MTDIERARELLMGISPGQWHPQSITTASGRIDHSVFAGSFNDLRIAIPCFRVSNLSEYEQGDVSVKLQKATKP